MAQPGSRCIPWSAWFRKGLGPSLLALLAGSPTLCAQVVEEAALFSASASRPRFGEAVGLSGDTLVVGVPEGFTTIVHSGAVDIFEREAGVWTLTQTLEPPGLHIDDYFGQAVAIEGELLVVGTGNFKQGGHGNPGYLGGAAWVYRRLAGTWTLEQKLQPLASASHDRVGMAVALAGDCIVLGAPGDDTLADGAGSVYVYRLVAATWELEQQLFAPTPAAGAGFGRAVALAGDTLVVGAPAASGAASGSGKATVFVHAAGVWSVQAELSPVPAAPDDGFGWALALDGDALAVGVPRADPQGVGNAGEVHVWRRSAGVWTEEARLAGAGGRPADNFGTAVALEGELLLAGVPDDDDDGGFAGVTAVFRCVSGRWLEAAELRGSTAQQGDRAGASVALDGDRAVSAGPNGRFDVPYMGVGHVWVFSGLLGVQP